MQAITSPSEFKDLCDRLLRLEFGRRFQSFGGLGSDGGIDGLWTGIIDGVDGDWVFQYKFVYPPVKGRPSAGASKSR